MEIFYRVLEVINYIVIGICAITMLFQLVMILFSWLPEKHFKKSDKLSRIAIIICARNEASVIKDTLNHLLNDVNYPSELYDIYLVADNCTDDTASIAASVSNRIKVITHYDDNPSHHRVAYPLQYGLEHILSLKDKFYDFIIRIDADNVLDKDYLRYMNDAFNSGVEIARGYEASKNITQNVFTEVSGTYYMRDSFIACNFREYFHLDSMLTGAGMMVSTSVLNSIKGKWDAFSLSEDAEFTLNRLLENKRVHYVCDAVIYEDQPSNLKETHKRVSRMGNGIHKVFHVKGWKTLFHFFKSGRWSNVDLFVQLMAIPMALLCCLWFPIYYAFYVLIHLINGLGPNFLGNVVALDGSLLTAEKSISLLLTNLLPMIGIVLATYLILFPLQTFIAVYRSKKKLHMETIKPLTKGILISPLYMVIYAISITIGILTRAGWKTSKRNVSISKK